MYDVGHHDMFETIITNSDDMKKWYETGTGNMEAVKELSEFVTEHLIPSLKIISVHGGCCVTAKVSNYT